MSDNDMQERYRKYLEAVEAQFASLPFEPLFAGMRREERMLPSGDGTALRTQYFFPDEPLSRQDLPSAFPAIAVRCCYPFQASLLELRAKGCTKYGFAFIVQWCRGTGGSEGAWEPNVNERPDGLSFLSFLEEDPRIESVGLWGDSYLALTGWALADALPSKVKTMVLGVYGCKRHTSAYQDGLFRQDVLTSWAMDNAGHKVEADYLTSAAYRPQVRVDEALWGGALPWYRDWITHPDRNDAYWSEGFWQMLSEIPGRVRIPLYIREGWYDHHLGSALETWECLGEEAAAHSLLEIGPWNHPYQTVIPHETPNLIHNDITGPLTWFDRILRRGELPEREIRRYVIGEDRWEVLRGNNVPAGQVRTFFLGSREGCRTLSEALPETDGNTRYIYDPENPVMSHGAESMLKCMNEVGSLPQPEPDWRDDVVSFLSDPLTENLPVDGRIRVRLFVSSDAEDTAFAAKLMEVFPDGRTFNVRGSITTLAYRDGRDSRTEYTPGEKVQASILFWDIAWTFRAGSRLRLDITSSDFPQYSVHTNFPGIWSLQEKTKKAEQTLWFGPASPSAIELPIAAGTKA